MSSASLREFIKKASSTQIAQQCCTLADVPAQGSCCNERLSSNTPCQHIQADGVMHMHHLLVRHPVQPIGPAFQESSSVRQCLRDTAKPLQ